MSFFKPGQLVLFEGKEKLLDSEQVAALSARKQQMSSAWVKELKEVAVDDLEYQKRLKRATGESSVCPCTGECICEDYTISPVGLLLFRRKVYIPDDVQWQTRVVKEHHNSKFAGHFGQDKTYEMIKRNFWFPGLEAFVRKYVSSCDICQRNKSRRHKPYKELQGLKVPYTLWSHISMDFIIELPKVKGYSIIWVVVDRFSKMAHFIPLKTTQAKELADAFIQYIWKYHGLPISIVSDRDLTFTSRFCMALMRALEVDLSLSTAYHLKTDGQTEIVNQMLEQYLRCFVNYLQDKWIDLLHFAEFAYNNAEHSSTKMSPFYACTGQHPRALLVGNEEIKTSKAAEWVKDMEEIKEELRKNLLVAQQCTQKGFNRKVQAGPEFKIGDLVLLNARNVKTKRESKKLDNLYRGPCKIIKTIGTNAYKLELPPQLQGKMHDVFHVFLLEPYIENSIPERETPPPPPVGDDLDFYEVEEILDSRTRHRKVEYLVHWKGYNPDDRTWETFDNLIVDGQYPAVPEFHRNNPGKL